MKDNKNDPEINAASFSIEKFDLPSPIVKLAKVFFFFRFFLISIFKVKYIGTRILKKPNLSPFFHSIF